MSEDADYKKEVCHFLYFAMFNMTFYDVRVRFCKLDTQTLS